MQQELIKLSMVGLGPLERTIERRIHKVFVTRNSEYHVRRNVCVGVRDRNSGQWIRVHLALQSRVHGSLRFEPSGNVIPNPTTPSVGESLLFNANGQDVVTSTILAIERPTRDIVREYTHLNSNRLADA